jgi:hypothetical protein
MSDTIVDAIVAAVIDALENDFRARGAVDWWVTSPKDVDELREVLRERVARAMAATKEER